MNTFMRFPGGKPKALTFSYDDGVISDRRLIEIFNKYNMKGTFNINSGLFNTDENPLPVSEAPKRRMTLEESIDTYKDSGHEVAVHALTHPFLEQLPDAMLSYEVLQDRINLEDTFGTIVRGMAYPFGTFSDKVVSALESLGIAYSRTVIASKNFNIPTDWLRLEATCHHNDPKLNELADQFLAEGPAYKRARLFYVWGHSYEFVDNDNWEVIENFCEKLANKDNVWYATNIEIYDYIKAYDQLQFSYNGSIVTNPTAYDLWFCDGNDTICVKSGETKKSK